MTEKELLLKVLGKLYNIPADEVSSLLYNKEADPETLKPDAADLIFDKDKTRIANFDKEHKANFDKGYNKAKAEVMSKLEKEVREKYSISEEKQGLELIDAVVAKTSTAGEADEEKVKRSKVFLDTVDALKKEKEKVAKEWEDKFQGREKQLQKEATYKTVTEKAKAFIQSLNPILPADKTKAENQLNIILGQLGNYDFEIQQDGRILVFQNEGGELKTLVDEHKHPVRFEDLVKSKANSFWDFKQGDQRAGTGNNNDGGGDGSANGGYKGPIPKTEAEYLDLIAKTTDEKTQIEITKVYQANKSK